MRRLSICMTAAALLAPLVAAPTTALAAGTSFTWTGEGTSTSWSDASNWIPNGVPGDGDSVSIAPTENTDSVSQVPAVALADLTLTGDPHEVSLGDGDGTGSVTVTRSLTWDGGTLDVPLRLEAGATGQVGSAFGKDVAGGTLTIAGTLTLEDIGDDPYGGRLQTDWDHRIVIEPQGRLVSVGHNLVMSSRCCASAYPGAVDNGGTIAVPSGRLHLSIIELDQHGTIDVARGATMSVDHTVVRLQDAQYRGGGELNLSDTDGPGPDAQHPHQNQGAALLLGTATLADGFRLSLGSGTELTGTGAVAGTGALDLAGARVYAAVRTGPHVTVRTVAGTTTVVGDWDRTVQGYHGAVRLEGSATVTPGSVLQLDHDTTTTIARGGHLTVPAGAQVVSGSCCTAAATLITEAGATMTLGGGPGAAAVLRAITTTNQGTIAVTGAVTWDKSAVSFTSGSVLSGHGTITGDVVNDSGLVEPTGTLTISGSYTAGPASGLRVRWGGSGSHPTTDRLAVRGEARTDGSLVATGTSKPRVGTTVTPFTATSTSGAFSCVTARGWIPEQSGTTVTLTRTGAATGGCGTALAARRVVKKVVRAGRKAHGRVKVPASAHKVLLAVDLSRAGRRTAVTIAAAGGGRAKVKVRPHKHVKRFVVVKVGHKHRLTVRSKHGKVRAEVNVRGWYR